MQRVSRLLLIAMAGASTFAPACSSESSLVGQGACEGYCFKVVGAKCKDSPTKQECLDECLFHQSDCARPWNDFVRCATIDATIACDSSSSQPRVVGCDHFEGPVQSTCRHYFPDAGPSDPS